MSTHSDAEIAELEHTVTDLWQTLALRNSEFGERIEQQAATIEALKTMSSMPDETQPVFDQIVRRAKELCNGDTAASSGLRNGLVHFGAMHIDVDFNAPALASYMAQYPVTPREGPSSAGRFSTGRSSTSWTFRWNWACLPSCVR